MIGRVPPKLFSTTHSTLFMRKNLMKTLEEVKMELKEKYLRREANEELGCAIVFVLGVLALIGLMVGAAHLGMSMR